jgi:hypothetical protein
MARSLGERAVHNQMPCPPYGVPGAPVPDRAACLPKQIRGAFSCLQGAPAGVPQTVASFPCATQNPSGPRHPEPPLQPQPVQRQESSAKAVDGAGEKY